MILVPISDDNDEGHAWHHHDFINYGLILACIVMLGYEIWVIVTGGPPALVAFVDAWSFDPRILGDNFLKASFPERVARLAKYLAHVENLALVKFVVSTFLHGGLMHLFSNMLVLWMLGDNVEYAMGHLRYLLFFLVTGILSACGETVFSTWANFRGEIGASGAIMAVAGAYLVYFPKAQINFFYLFMVFWWGVFAVPARLVIGVYFLTQVATAYTGWGSDYEGIGVWAHVTGFTLGLLLAWPLRKDREKPLYQPTGRRAYARSVAATLRQRRNHDHWG